MALPTPARDVLRFKDEKEFRYIGKGAVQIYDLHDITTGKAVYAADVSVPGMLYAAVARPPVVGGTVKSVDDAAAKAVPGVQAIVQIPGAPLGSKFKPLGGVAVVATNTWAAIQGRDALVIEWDDGPHASYNTAAYEQELRASANAPGTPVRNQGDAEAALAGAAKVFTQRVLRSSTWCMRRWSRRRRSRASPTASARCGAACRAPTARASTSPTSSVSIRRT